MPEAIDLSRLQFQVVGFGFSFSNVWSWFRFRGLSRTGSRIRVVCLGLGFSGFRFQVPGSGRRVEGLRRTENAFRV